ncbi:MAG: protein kinase, partial [Pirellulales bacterium]
MTKPFDPYHHWLAIPPAEQPANCYRLLGVAQFESDPSVIESAADRQMAHVRTFASGPHAAVSQRMLNELSQARVTLLDPKRRVAYDTVLKRAAPADRVEEAPRPVAVQGKPVIVEPPPGMSAEPRQLGPYKIEERITSSALGVIYKASDTRDGRNVSIKILPPQAARNPEILKRFRRECDLMTKLDHPHLIAGIEAGEERGVPYLVTEYVVGMDLGTLVQTHGPLDVDYARDYLAQAARALMQLHFNGVFHRNLKPQVLLVDL